MSTVWPRLEPILPRVSRPARYIGGEQGAQTPVHDPAKVAWLLGYPDTYEIGLPNQGLQILYEILNERADALAERTYAPWSDLAAEMRAHDVPLFSVDSHRPASDFDIMAFNLSAELTYTNLLDMVDLAGCPVRVADRDLDDLFIGAGGHCTYNPEPIAPFLDFVVLGDGEEVVGEISAVLAGWKSDRAAGADLGRVDALALLAEVEGVYVPSLYEATHRADGRLQATRAVHPAAPQRVEKRTIADLGEWPYPRNQLVPLTEVVHDRLNVEVFRGCTRGCRFCQAGMITRPVRERPAEQVRTMVADGLERTGYDEVALTSLSTADFSGIEGVVSSIMDGGGDGCGDAGLTSDISVSLPSLRVDAFTVGIAAEIQRARRTGLTFAPEAGTWRLRQVINKLISEDDLYGAVESAYSQGWRRMKLYFLVGLPTETDEDTLGIAALARNVVAIGRRYHKNPSVTVSVGGFVPKPFTPFQWFGQNTRTELDRKIRLLRDELRRDRGVQLKWHDPKATTVEGLVTRGDRRLADVIEDVWRHGGAFQEWSECFDFELWLAALERAGLTVEELAYRHRTLDEPLPWDHLSAGLHKDFLWQDWRDALDAVGLEDCRWIPCYDCGACTGYGIEHVVASAVPPAGGSQGTGGASPVAVALTPATAGGGDLMRIRVRYSKLGKIRFTSHRDVARIWERTLRRAGVPVARSNGFSPRPKLHFGLALSTGHESLAEYLDVDLVEGASVDLAELPARLSAALPAGLDATTAAAVPPGTPSLQHAVTISRWEIDVLGLDLATLSSRTEALLAAPELVMVRQRKGTDVTDDVRAHLLHLQPTGPVEGGCRLVADLGTQTRGLRPSELLTLLGEDACEGKVCRTHQFTEHDGVRSEPLTSGDERATPVSVGAVTTTGSLSPAPHAQVRAS